MAAATILDFWNRKILLAIWVDRVKTHQHAKFSQNRSIVCENIKIFRIFMMAAAVILDSFGEYWEHPLWVIVGLYQSARFGYDRCSSFYDMNISIFDAFGWKMLIHAPKIRGLGANCSPKWDAISTKAKKGTPLRESVSFEPLSVKIWRAVWPVGVFLYKRGINKKHFGLYFTYLPEAPHVWISTKFCTTVEDTCDKFFSDRWRDVNSVVGQKCRVPI